MMISVYDNHDSHVTERGVEIFLSVEQIRVTSCTYTHIHIFLISNCEKAGCSGDADADEDAYITGVLARSAIFSIIAYLQSVTSPGRF